MSKSIKVSEEVYLELLKLQRPRETFSEIIGRLLLMSELLRKIVPYIRAQAEYLESRRAGQEAQHPVD